MVASAVYSAATPATAVPLDHGTFAALAARCAPTVPVQTLQAVAMTESGLDPLAVHDNTTGEKEVGSWRRTVSDAVRWVQRGDSVDIGLMQINSANLPALDMTTSEAFDPCTSMAAGAEILRAAYGVGNTPAEQQIALLMALSRYNTGSPFRGILNGYARTVLTNTGTESLPVLLPLDPAGLPSDPDAPPSWNISEAGTYAQAHGAPWLVALAPAVPGQSVPESPLPSNPTVHRATADLLTDLPTPSTTR